MWYYFNRQFEASTFFLFFFFFPPPELHLIDVWNWAVFAPNYSCGKKIWVGFILFFFSLCLLRRREWFTVLVGWSQTKSYAWKGTVQLAVEWSAPFFLLFSVLACWMWWITVNIRDSSGYCETFVLLWYLFVFHSLWLGRNMQILEK